MSYDVQHHMLLVTTASGCQVQVKWCRNFNQRGTYELTINRPGDNAPFVLKHEDSTHEAIKACFRIAKLIDQLGYDAVRQAYELPF